jgi:hypothetical protein
MDTATRLRWLGLLMAVLSVLGGALDGGPLALAEGGTPVGGAVESTLALSLGEPSPFAHVRAGRGRSEYSATIPVEVTATDAPVRLSIADGEEVSGTGRGHMVRGHSTLPVALQAAAGRGGFRSLDASFDPVLEQWLEPVSLEGATIRMRQMVRGAHPPSIGGYHKLLLITVAVAGP